MTSLKNKLPAVATEAISQEENNSFNRMESLTSSYRTEMAGNEFVS